MFNHADPPTGKIEKCWQETKLLAARAHMQSVPQNHQNVHLPSRNTCHPSARIAGVQTATGSTCVIGRNKNFAAIGTTPVWCIRYARGLWVPTCGGLSSRASASQKQTGPT